MAQNNPFGNFYLDLLEDDPRMAFQAAIPYAGFSTLARPEQRQRDYWSNQYSNIYNEFLGHKGQGLQELASGENKPRNFGTFSEFLSNTPFTERYGALTPQQKGTGIRSFAPQTRHIYF
tara:strand:+ start:226 stop:582 length:357 start_codon:yes stop_codon:yes gene_type:complete